MKIPFLGDVIIKEGCVGTKMYFIQEGIVDIVMGTGEVHIIFCNGHWGTFKTVLFSFKWEGGAIVERRIIFW